MKILVSACLLGENCKYNGGNNLSEKVVGLSASHEVIAVCPEILGGLETPRSPAEIVNGTVINRDGECVDHKFRRGAYEAVRIARENNVTLAVLQPRSPSCGVHRIYDGTFSGKIIKGKGIFARMLEEEGIVTMEPDEIDV